MKMIIIVDSKTLKWIAVRSIGQTQLGSLALCIQATNSANNGRAIDEATFIPDTDLAGSRMLSLSVFLCLKLLL